MRYLVKWPTQVDAEKIAECLYMNSKRDLEKKEMCATCNKDFMRKEMRGARDGSWLCVPCWEDMAGHPAPPPLPNYRAPAPVTETK